MRGLTGQFVQVEQVGSVLELPYALRSFIDARRQFTVKFNDDGTATISAPYTGPRDPKDPQPQPPIAVARAA
jgi:hypothetical protein